MLWPVTLLINEPEPFPPDAFPDASVPDSLVDESEIEVGVLLSGNVIFPVPGVMLPLDIVGMAVSYFEYLCTIHIGDEPLALQAKVNFADML
jgi:hypothetical protein